MLDENINKSSYKPSPGGHLQVKIIHPTNRIVNCPSSCRPFQFSSTNVFTSPRPHQMSKFSWLTSFYRRTYMVIMLRTMQEIGSRWVFTYVLLKWLIHQFILNINCSKSQTYGWQTNKHSRGFSIHKEESHSVSSTTVFVISRAFKPAFCISLENATWRWTLC